jgi:uncharacterized membrane protein
MPRLHDLSLTVRVVVTLVASGLLAVVLPGSLSVQTRALVVWNGAVLVFLGLIVPMIIGTTPDQVRDNARSVGHARARVLVGGLVTSLSSLLMVAVILSAMERHQPGFRTQINLCVAAVFSSWFLLQTFFALFYARQYWQPAPGQGDAACAGGLDFPDEPAPDYWDFLYFSFTLGMCYQTSDVQIQSRTLRRVALLQSILSYIFLTIIIGLVINAIGSVL